MKTDRELLELAAKAAGYRVAAWKENETALVKHPSAPDSCMVFPWAPLKDDGDALRLAVKLSLHVQCDFDEDETVIVYGECSSETVQSGSGLDDYAATRRAIVRAAAAIGESMP